MSERGQALINEVRMVAAKNPDFVYQAPEDPAGASRGCLYVHDGCPSCLVGQAMWNLGMIDAELEGEESNHCAIRFFPRISAILDDDEIAWLGRVQERQDNGEPWGHCVGIS